MKVYIDGVLTECQISPSIAETKDITLDTGNIILSILKKNDKEPVKPDTPVTIELDDGRKLYFVVAFDNVSLFSLSLQVYKHSVSLVQNTRTLSKHLLRNTMFSTPTSKIKSVYYASSWQMFQWANDMMGEEYCYMPVSMQLILNEETKRYSFDPNNLQEWSDKTTISPREKIISVYYQVKNFAITKLNIGETGNSSLEFPEELSPEQDLNKDKFDFYITDGTHTVQIRARDKEKHFLNPDLFKDFDGVVEIKLNYTGNEHTTPITSTQFDSENKYAVVTRQIYLYFEVSYYTLYSVLDIINRQYIKTTALRNPKDLFLLPTKEQDPKLYDILNKTYAPNLTFTNSTIFDAIQQVYNVFDATPKLTYYGENTIPTLGAEYLNEREEEIDLKIIGESLNQTEEKFFNGAIVNYQNGYIDCCFPGKNAYAHLRNNYLGVPTDDYKQWGFLVDHPIHTIKSFKAKVWGDGFIHLGNSPLYCFSIAGLGSLPVQTCSNFNVEVDLTPFLVEQSVYASLDTTDRYPFNGSYQNITQINAIPFQQDTNYVQIGGNYEFLGNITYLTFWNVLRSAFLRFLGAGKENTSGSHSDSSIQYPSDEDFKSVLLNLEYTSKDNGRIRYQNKISQYRGELLLNQENGALDLEKLGINVNGQLLMMGAPKVTINRVISKESDAVHKGQYIKYNNYKYVVNVSSISYFPNYIMETIELVREYNNMANFIGVDSAKRLYNIDDKLTVFAEDTMDEYIFFSRKLYQPTKFPFQMTPFGTGEELLSFVAKTFFDVPSGVLKTRNIDYATILTYDERSNAITPNEVFIPLKTYSTGNTLCLEVNFDDQISAGYQTTDKTGWWTDTRYYTGVIKYTDDNGFFDKITINFYENGGEDFTTEFPVIKDRENDYRVARISSYEFFKKPNEIFGLNYCLHVIPIDNDLYAGRGFFNDFSFKRRERPLKTMYMYLNNTNETYSPTSLYCLGVRKELSSKTYDPITGGATGLKLTFKTLDDNTYNGYAIGDEQGNIYFSCNDKITPTNGEITFSIYFYNNLYDNIDV